MATVWHTAGLLQPRSRALVVGLGRSGRAAASWLNSRGLSVRVSTAEPEETIAPDTLAEFARRGITIEAGGHRPETFMDVDSIILSPGVDPRMELLTAARQRRIPVVGETALALACCPVPALGISGTNGKSTVTTLMGDILHKSGKKIFVGGNLGTPLFEWLGKNEPADMVVLELSSFQLETLPLLPEAVLDLAMLLNISPDHLGRYASYDQYAMTKMHLFSHQDTHDIAICNNDDPKTAQFIHMIDGPRLRYFGSSRRSCHAWWEGSRIFAKQNSHEPLSIDCDKSFFATQPNLSNACAALCAAQALGIGPEPVQQAIFEYTPLDHRMQLVATVDGVPYLDDSKATNIGAVAAALAAMDRPVLLIAGGRDKGGDYSLLSPLIRQKVKAALLLGEAQETMARCFAPLTRVEHFSSMAAAVAGAHTLAVPGDIVLLSPACASFDMYSSYHHRGLDFQRAVHALTAARPQHKEAAS